MKYDVVILRSQDIVSDSRVLRYEKNYIKNNIKYQIIGWDRAHKNIKRSNTIYCRNRAGFQKRIFGIWGRLAFNFFLFKWLLCNLHTYKCVHACDLDTILPALCMKFFNKKVIFDIFDWYSDEFHTGYKYIDVLINTIECFCVRHSDLVIICESERLKQMMIYPKRYLVIRNMDDEYVSKGDKIEMMDNDVRDDNDDIHITYVGGLVRHRGIIELLEIASVYPYITVSIAGFGEYKILEKVIGYSERYKNINYYGYLQYDAALRLMENSDLLYAMYYTSNHNHVYAAPNKFYEGLILGKPILTNEGTLVSVLTKRYNSGFVIGEGKEDLENFFSNVRLTLKSFTHRNTNIAVKFFLDQQKENLDKYLEFLDSKV